MKKHTDNLKCKKGFLKTCLLLSKTVKLILYFSSIDKNRPMSCFRPGVSN